MEILPGEKLAANRLKGFFVDLSDGTHSYRHYFPFIYATSAVRRAEHRLLNQKILEPKEVYIFFMSAIPPEKEAYEAASGSASRDAQTGLEKGKASGLRPMVIRRRSMPLNLEKASLAEYIDASESLTGVYDLESKGAQSSADPMPVFVTEDAWRQGHKLARLGGQRESAAVCTGRLLRDTASSELFMLIEACIQAEHAEETSFSVMFSGETWSRIRDLLEIRRRRLNRPNEIILGTVHGHNFFPGTDTKGQRRCWECEDRKTCKQSTAVASQTDAEWHWAHFSRQPWAVMLVWGWNARDEEEWRLYGLSNATLGTRPLRLLKSNKKKGLDRNHG
jgi:hypothetical protein